MALQRNLALEENPAEEKEEEEKKEEPPFTLEKLSIEQLAEFINQIDSCILLLSEYLDEAWLDTVFCRETLLLLLASISSSAFSYLTWGTWPAGLRPPSPDVGCAITALCFIGNNYERISKYGDRQVNTIAHDDLEDIRQIAEKLQIDLTNQTLQKLSAVLQKQKTELDHQLQERIARKIAADKEAGWFLYCTHDPHSDLYRFFAQKKVGNFLKLRDYLDEPRIKSRI